MTAFPGSPRLLKGGIVLIDPDTSAVLRVIALQYNPDTLTRTLQVKGVGAESGDRSEVLRLKGPPSETIKVDVEIDATDQLETAQPDDIVSQLGIHPQLAALETIIYPSSLQLNVDDLGFDHTGGNLFMVYQMQKEFLATMNQGGGLSALGIRGIP